ncbi:hypothetical protein NEOC65_000563 [Neochlamydia sp. AcF65]|nr:hypothetical protein [Neochlamydia sp. AcF65]MBS4171296.1 hypothetical protein [Neochlamydia sp. AcF95]NGY94314.1 hypothetical protein [Neochlamydia sp. AcF84]
MFFYLLQEKIFSFLLYKQLILNLFRSPFEKGTKTYENKKTFKGIFIELEEIKK